MKTQISLSTLIKVDLHDNHLSRIEVIDNEDYSGVIRKTSEYFREIGKVVDEDYLLRGVMALKQYYAVALLDPANAHAVSVPVDPFWHSHILHTWQYSVFCQNVVGEYMHHQPLDRGNKKQVQNVSTLYDYTLEVLDKIFVHVDQDFWPTADSDGALICFHKGNVEIYSEVQPFRLFEPDNRGKSYAF